MTDIDRKIHVDGVGVAIQDQGPRDALPLVFLHGGSRTLADWLFVVPSLADDFRVVTVDFRGHGRSDAVESYSWLDGVKDTAGVIDGLSLDDPVVIGHSLGGMTAIKYAADGGPCVGIINVDGFGAGHHSEFPGYEEEDAVRRLAGFAEESEKMFRAQVDTGDEAWMEGAIAAFKPSLEAMGVSWEVAEPLVRRGFRQLPDGRWQTSPSANVNASMYKSLSGTEHWSNYAGLTMPTLVVRGVVDEEQDDKDGGKFLAAYRRNIETHLEEEKARRDNFYVDELECGHMVMWQKPAELVDSIRRFVKSL